MARLRIHLFGNLRVTADSQVVAGLNKGRLQSLLAYLVLHADQPIPREHLAGTLWPDSTESQARTNLRQLIHHLRHALPPDCDLLVGDGQTVRWRHSAETHTDLAEFHDAMHRAEQARRQNNADGELSALEAACTLAHDDLLCGLYDEWLKPARDQVREKSCQALQRLASLLVEHGRADAAAQTAERLITIDPLRESGYRLLMEAHAANLDRAAALRAYHQCMRVLKRELGITPGDATRTLFESILRSEARPASAAPRSVRMADASMLPLIGRERECERLALCWRRAAEGPAFLALISGEPGIGKTRLAEELVQRCAGHHLRVARARCYAARGNLACAPVEEWLKSGPLKAVRRQLSPAHVLELARVVPEILPDTTEEPPPRPLTDSWQRRHFYEALRAAFSLAAAAHSGGEGPLLLLIDDLQWCDQDSLACLHFLLTSGISGMLIVATVRPEESFRPSLATFLSDLRQAEAVEEITLDALPNEASAELAARVANGPLDPAYLGKLCRATGGNPLFVIESVRAKVEGAPATAPEDEVPVSALPRVQAVISQRLAQLSPAARELAGVAAVVETAFSFDLLGRVTDWDEESIARALDELWRRRIVESAREDQRAYDFTHDRLREVVTDELSPVRRRFLHGRVARALVELRQGEQDAVIGRIAAHREAAGMIEDAVAAWSEAAAVARRRYADAEAAGLIRRALALCQELPQSVSRLTRELQLLSTLGNVLMTAEGYAGAECGGAFHRAIEAARKVGDARSLAIALVGAAFFHIVRADFAIATQLSEEALQLGKSDADLPAAMEPGAQFMLAVALHHTGRVEEAAAAVDRAWQFYQDADGPLSLFGGLDMRVFCASYRSHMLWLSGQHEAATRQIEHSLALARAQDHPFPLALALDYAAMLHVFADEPEGALTCAGDAADISERYSFSYYHAWAEILKGWALARVSDPREGRALLERGLERLRATGAQLRLPFYYALLAETHSRCGQQREALAAVATGFAYQGSTGETWAERYLQRAHAGALAPANALRARNA